MPKSASGGPGKVAGHVEDGGDGRALNLMVYKPCLGSVWQRQLSQTGTVRATVTSLVRLCPCLA